MVTLYRDAYQTENRADEYCGTSTEQKPTKNVENGSWFTEIDTGKKYRFDAENQKWDIWLGDNGGSSEQYQDSSGVKF